MTRISLNLNDEQITRDVEDNLLLAYFLRETLNLTGTHVGCDTTQCGCCVVHVNGKTVKSCTMLAVQANGATVRTIEGLAQNGQLHPVQEAFRQHHGLQCGFCTPGMIMTAVELIASTDTLLSEAQIREEMEGNLCRCTGYHNIVKSVLAADAQIKAPNAPGSGHS